MTVLAHDPNCLFCKIIAGHVPSRKIYEDDELLAFNDIHPWAPVHFLMVPKLHIPSLAQLQPEHADLMGRMMVLEHLYKLRHLVENAFLHLKRWRGIATRYAKNLSSFVRSER